MDSLFIEPPQLGPFGKTERHVVRIQHQGVRYVLPDVSLVKRPQNATPKTPAHKGSGSS
jgi:hypothetical protein